MFKSKEHIDTVRRLAREIVALSKKDGEEHLALAPFSFMVAFMRIAEQNKSWDLLILFADLISQLSTLIDEVDIPVEELANT